MRIARCGHGEYDDGHCGQPGCPNDWRACRDCNPSPKGEPKRDRFPNDAWDEAE